MIVVALVLIAIPLAALAYAYLLYPSILWAVTRIDRSRSTSMGDEGLPTITLTIPVPDGHTATFSYDLAETRGWDVRAQIDDLVLTRHCSSWRGVERFYDWIRLTPQTALPRRGQ